MFDIEQESSKTATPKSKQHRDTGDDITEKQERKSTTVIHTSTDDLRSGAFQYVLESGGLDLVVFKENIKLRYYHSYLC